MSPYHIDLTSVYSQREKDLETEQNEARKARRESKERTQRSLSWRNESVKRKDASTARQQQVSSPIVEAPRSQSKTTRQPIFGVKKSARKPSASPRHSYSPRYLEFLHRSPSGSPRLDKDVDYIKSIKVPGQKESRKDQIANRPPFAKKAF